MDTSRRVETASLKRKDRAKKKKNGRARILKDRLVDRVGVEPESHVPACSDIHECTQVGDRW